MHDDGHDGILMMGVATRECRKNSSYIGKIHSTLASGFNLVLLYIYAHGFNLVFCVILLSKFLSCSYSY